MLKAQRNALSEEIAALNPERDVLADQLIEVLERQSELYGEMTDIVREYDQDAANAIALSYVRTPTGSARGLGVGSRLGPTLDRGVVRKSERPCPRRSPTPLKHTHPKPIRFLPPTPMSQPVQRLIPRSVQS